MCAVDMDIDTSHMGVKRYMSTMPNGKCLMVNAKPCLCLQRTCIRKAKANPRVSGTGYAACGIWDVGCWMLGDVACCTCVVVVGGFVLFPRGFGGCCAYCG
jgi:hypothetical protein